MKIIRLDDKYSWIEPHWWLTRMQPPNKGLQGCDDLLIELRQHAPKGTVESHQNMPVILAPGKDIRHHNHPQWTLIYFIDAEDVPLTVENTVIYPANNTAILLEPHDFHSVARNTMLRPRLSLALRFADER